jgi:hypothetical protein
MAVLKDDAAVAAESGNSQDEIHKSYRDVKTPEQAKRFWAIAPNRKAALKAILKKPGAEPTITP